MTAKLIAISVTCLGLLASSVNAQVTPIEYTQGFANDSGSSKPPADYGWEAWQRRMNDDVRLGVSTSNRVVTFAGAEAVENVNALAPYGDNISAGFISVSNNERDQFHFVALEIPQNYFDDIALSVQFRIDGPSDNRFALRFGDDWYVTEQAFVPESDWDRFELNLDQQSLLVSLPFAAGTGGMPGISGDESITLGSLAMDISAVGVYSAGLDGNYRLDNFSAVAVPEPATVATLLGSLALILVFMRRRR